MYVQEDVFQFVGVPLVRNALAGYNTSILSYGQVLIDALCVVFLNFQVRKGLAFVMEILRLMVINPSIYVLYFFTSLEAERLIQCGVRQVPWLRIPHVIVNRELFLGSSECYFLSLKEYVLLPTLIIIILLNFCIMVF